MSRQKETTLTDMELALMEVIWEMGGATARDVHERLKDSLGYAYTSVLTVMTRLKDKRILDSKPEGKAYRFFPLISREEAMELSVAKVTEQFFKGSAQSLVAHLVRSDTITESELNNLRELIEKAKKEAS